MRKIDRRIVAIVLATASGTALAAAGTPASAQTSLPVPAQVNVNVSAQPLALAIAEFAHQTNAQILINSDLANGVTSTPVAGRYSLEQALSMLLRDTGLEWRRISNTSYAIVPSPNRDFGATPEILVRGQRQWTLNTGIRRSENDSQPFIVIQGETIRKSGAPDLETFLRNQLSVNASPTTAEQSATGRPNVSSINLRGLGERDTLVLVDGRRLPGVTNSDGSVGQGNIVGIPMAAVERIEVLASSASGIYGNGASGGVVNIIMRRDYRGIEVSANFVDTLKGGGRGVRLDATGGMALEGGRTNLTFTGSWTRTDPVLYRDRADLIVGGRRRAIANNPNFYRFISPLGSTPNIRNPSGRPLTLDPQYGGATLSSYYTAVPDGYRGVALDGVAPLVANAGQLSLDLADNAAAGGGASELLYGVRQASASVALRRDFNDWLKVYGELGWTRADRRAHSNTVPTTIFLDADAPGNPFTQPVFISVPFAGTDEWISNNRTQTYRGVLGAIVKLPADWQAVADLSRMRTSTSASLIGAGLSADGFDSFRNGEQNIVRDVRLAPAFDYRYNPFPYSFLATPQRNDILSGSLRLAGPLPMRLPGGKPTVTISAERSQQSQDAALRAQNAFNQSSVDRTSPGKVRIEAVYGEINVPLLGGEHHLPLVRELLVTLSVRHERYTESGSPQSNCYFNFENLPTIDIASLCTDPVTSATTRQSHTDPTVSIRWRPVDGVTFRGSYATGYLSPRLNQLVRQQAPQIFTNALDPLRGSQPIGTQDETNPDQYFVPGFAGGNSDVRPETSRTLTAGLILQPKFVSGLRLSADWTRIRKRDNYFDPANLLFPDGDASRQTSFETFLARYPDRIVRGPASGGFAAGPITSIDVSLANLVGSTSDSVDFSGAYSHALFGGTIEVEARATYVDKLSLQEVPGGPQIDFAGVVGDDFLFATDGGGFGALRWKGSGSLRWTGDRVSVAWQTRFFDSYFVNVDRAFDLDLGAAKIPRQFYHDISGSYAFEGGVTVRAGINNVFNKKPPLDTSISARLYSNFGDPRLANAYLTIVKSF